MKEKLGLVLEGGAMRGMFTAGVIDFMLEKEMSFDGCVGVSAGAAFGCNLKSKQKGRVLRYNLKYCGDKRYCSLRSLIKTHCGTQAPPQYKNKSEPTKSKVHEPLHSSFRRTSSCMLQLFLGRLQRHCCYGSMSATKN